MSVGVWSRWLIYITAGLVIIVLVWAEVDSADSVVEAHCQLGDGRVTDRLYLYTGGAAEFDYYGVPLGPRVGDSGCLICLDCAGLVLPVEPVIEKWVVSPAGHISVGELVTVYPTPVTTRLVIETTFDRTVPGSEWREAPDYLWPGMKELLGVWGLVAAGLATLAVGCLMLRTLES